jgi:hypothetical protein
LRCGIRNNVGLYRCPLCGGSLIDGTAPAVAERTGFPLRMSLFSGG